MSKSFGNLVVVRQCLERAPAAAVRLYLASHHYRRDWSFRWEGLDRAVALAARIRDLVGVRRGAGAGPAARGEGLGREITAARNDALDTPAAVRGLPRARRQP